MQRNQVGMDRHAPGELHLQDRLRRLWRLANPRQQHQDPILGIFVINSNIDSVTETRLTSQNDDAEFGLAAAGLMLYTTKSGANDLHGSVLEFNRTNSPGFQIYGRDPFQQNVQLRGRGDYVPPQACNQFDGSVGGRVLKNRLFSLVMRS